MSDDKNIIEFPGIKKSKNASDIEAPEQLIENKKAYVDAIVKGHAWSLYNSFSLYGFDTTDPMFVKYFNFLTDMMAATLYMSIGLHHPFHDIIEKDHGEDDEG